MTSVLVISPHLDDAVLSTGETLCRHPGATVVTVFAGVPSSGTTGHHDRAMGRTDSHQVMLDRRREDEVALSRLGATPVHLDFLDRQYRHPYDDDAIAEQLGAVLDARQPAVVMGPLGLLHPDHRQVARVWLRIAETLAPVPTVVYEDLPYRVQYPTLAHDRVLALVSDRGAAPWPGTDERDAEDTAVKTHALRAYASQRASLPVDACLTAERLWLLPPAALRPDTATAPPP